MSAPASDEVVSLKRRAAEAALGEVASGMRLGLGSGSTVAHFLELLSVRVEAGLDVAGVPTSVATAEAAQRLGIPLSDFADDAAVDLAVDGADEVAPGLDLIKGLGGALTRERVVADAAQRFVIIADASKAVEVLGERAPVPVEVVPFAVDRVRAVLSDLGPAVRVVDGALVVTDNGNHLIDLGAGVIEDPAELARRLDATPGVVDHGLFLGMADVAYVASGGGVRKVER